MKNQNHIQKQIFDFLAWHNLMNVTSWRFYPNILKLAYFSKSKLNSTVYYMYSVELTYSAEGDRSLMFIPPLYIDSLGSSITVHF